MNIGTARDLKHGTTSFADTKDGKPRYFAMQPGTVEALKIWRDHFMRTKRPDAYVFADPATGELPDRFSLAAELRAYLKEAGVERPQLFLQDEHHIALRVHDLRASYVTVALAQRKSEAEISEHTGHSSSVMINQYRRWARTHRELHLGDFTPLVDAIPELRKKKGKG